MRRIASLLAIALPAGFTVESTAISGNRILLYGTAQDGAKRIIVHDIGTGKTVTEIDLK